MNIIKILKQEKLLNWNTLLYGFECGWCNRIYLKEYAENCILQAKKEQIDPDLIRILFDEPLSHFDIIDIIKRIIKKDDQLLHEKENDIVDKWKYAFLVDLLEKDCSDDEKIDILQEIYAKFDYPEDMRSCKAYSPANATLSTARKLITKLKLKFNKGI